MENVYTVYGLGGSLYVSLIESLVDKRPPILMKPISRTVQQAAQRERIKGATV